MGLPEKLNGMLVWVMKKLHLEEGVFYVGSSESLPVPLSAEEEQQYLQQLAENSEHARKELIEHNLRLVVEEFDIPVDKVLWADPAEE